MIKISKCREETFISEDPIGLEGGDVNFYSYVFNSPNNWIDPLGLAGCTECHKPPPPSCTECHKPSPKPDQVPKGEKCWECDKEALEKCLSVIVDDTSGKYLPPDYKKRKDFGDAAMVAACYYIHCKRVNCAEKCHK